MADRKVFSDSIVPLPVQEGSAPNGLVVAAAQPIDKETKLRLHFNLSINPSLQSELERRVAKGEIVPLEELHGKYAPERADSDALTQWLQKQGLTLLDASPGGSSIYVEGTVAQISKCLQVDFTQVMKDGRTYVSAQNAPSLPAKIGEPVRSILGLQPFMRINKHFVRRRPLNDNRVDTPGTPTTNISNEPPYIVSEILKAYNADSLGATGAGQTIAILIDTVPNMADVQNFWARNGIANNPGRITFINVGGVTLPPAEGEETLDVEWASGIAPGADIRVYASGSLNFVDLDRALDRIIADLATVPSMKQLSISLGLGELFMGSATGEVATQNQKFLKLAAAGVNTFVSSGDAGSNPDSSGHGTTATPQAEFPASVPWVVGVGGTLLKLNPDGSVASETGWTGSGGGKSKFFKKPTWQKGAGVPHGTSRFVPDVSLVASPETGAMVVLNGSVVQIGGTSWSAPVWAAFSALMNDARAKSGKSAMGFISPTLYAQNRKPAFRDVKQGTNGTYSAGPGFDLVTGLGVPNVSELLKALP